MKSFDKITKEDLLGLPLKSYFNYFANNLKKEVNLEFLTILFTELQFKEKKPYLTRRKLLPNDKRFKEIEIVYDKKSNNKVMAIVWDFQFTLRELLNLFGTPVIEYEPYSNTTYFKYIMKSDIKFVKTGHQEHLNDIINLKKLELVDILSNNNRILDIEFTFLQMGF